MQYPDRRAGESATQGRVVGLKCKRCGNVASVVMSVDKHVNKVDVATQWMPTS